MKKLILASLLFTGSAFATTPQSLLKSNYNSFTHKHSQIGTFASAAKQDRQWDVLFCDRESLVNTRGKTLVKFTFSSNCEQALTQINQQLTSDVRLFCNGSELYNTYGRKILDLTFDSHCKRAVADVVTRSQPVTLVCADGKLYNGFGDSLLDLTFQSSCLKSLKTLYVPHRYAREGLICADGKLYSTNGNLVEDLSFQSSCKRRLNEISQH